MLRNTLRLRASSEGRTNLVVGLLSKVRIHISGEVWLQPTRWQRSLKGGPDRSWSRVARQAENAPLGYSGISLACRLQRDSEHGAPTLWRGDAQPRMHRSGSRAPWQTPSRCRLPEAGGLVCTGS